MLDMDLIEDVGYGIQDMNLWVLGDIQCMKVLSVGFRKIWLINRRKDMIVEMIERDLFLEGILVEDRRGNIKLRRL